MTGPEHYRAAEVDMAAMNGKSQMGVQALLARAQVHALLALAAATALGREGAGRMLPSKDRDAWFAAAAECKKGESA